ncbi:MAG: hypothetical protein ACLU80_10665 [Dorea sp.]
MSNAIKYTPDGHSIHVTINEMEFDVIKKALRYVFVCEDILEWEFSFGISSTYLRVSFPENIQLRRIKSGGAGLGLSICEISSAWN